MYKSTTRIMCVFPSAGRLAGVDDVYVEIHIPHVSRISALLVATDKGDNEGIVPQLWVQTGWSDAQNM